MRELPIQMSRDYHGENHPRRRRARNAVLFLISFAATFGAAYLILAVIL